MDERELSNKTVTELRALAADLGVKGRARLRKAELLAAILLDAGSAQRGRGTLPEDEPDGPTVAETEDEAARSIAHIDEVVVLEPAVVTPLEAAPIDVTPVEVQPVLVTPMMAEPALVMLADEVVSEPAREPIAASADLEPPPHAPADVVTESIPVAAGDGYPGGRLRAMVRDPGTVYVYWEPSKETEAEGFEVKAVDSDEQVLDSFRTDERGRSGYIRVTPGAQGRVQLRPIRNGEVGRPIAAAWFSMSTGAPSDDRTERWVDVRPDQQVKEPARPPRAGAAWQIPSPSGAGAPSSSAGPGPVGAREALQLPPLPTSSTIRR